MKKKLIAAAVVAGLAAPMAAQADVTVYGQLQLELANTDNGTKTTDFQDKGNSKIGVRYSEDLGGGMKAMGLLEWGPNTTAAPTGATGLIHRQSWLGLSGGFGTLKIGTMNSAYKVAGGVKYDALVATTLQARGSGGMNNTPFTQGSYMANTIDYSNKFGMAKIELQYSPAEMDDSALSHKDRGSKGDMAASLVVNFNGGQAGVAYSKDNAATGTTGPEGEKNTKIFGKYGFGNNTILGQYEQTKYGTGGTDHKNLFLSYQLKMPNMNMLVASLGQQKNDTGANPKTNYAAIGFFHHMSKKTAVFAGYMNSKKDGSTATKVITVGLKEAF